jgi:hypothetical protein
VGVREVARRGEVVARAGVHVAGLEADDRRNVAARLERPPEGLDVDRPVRAGRHGLDRARPDAEQAERAIDRRVPLLARDHAHPGRRRQPARLDVPPRPREHPVPRRREADRVRALGAGDESEGRVAGQAECLLQPPARHLLDESGDRRARGVERHLVPAGCEHVRSRGGLERSSDDEPEVARAD